MGLAIGGGHELERSRGIRLHQLLKFLAVRRSASGKEDKCCGSSQQHRPDDVCITAPRTDVFAERAVAPRVVLRLDRPLLAHRIREEFDAVRFVYPYGRGVIDRLGSALLALTGTRERLRLPFREDKGVCAEQPELGRVVQAVYARQPSLETSVPALSFFLESTGCLAETTAFALRRSPA